MASASATENMITSINCTWKVFERTLDMANQPQIRAVEMKSIAEDRLWRSKGNRPMSAYNYFCQAWHSNMKAVCVTGGVAKPSVVISRVAAEWNILKNDKLRAEELQIYIDLAAQSKKRFIETNTITTIYCLRQLL